MADGGDLGVRCTGNSPSFSKAVLPIIMKRCAGAEMCHGGFGGGQETFKEFVNAPVTRDTCNAGVRVFPGDLERSYIMHKLTGVGMCPNSNSMPPGEKLRTEDIQTIADWICAGAKDD